MKLFASFLMVALFAVSAVAADDKAAAKVAKPDLAKGEASFSTVCAACHGADGNSGSPANPKLAQQHPEYLLKQLHEFKSGKRANAVMSGMVAALSDDDMRNIAYWLASKQAKPGFAKDKDTVALGERIYRGGIADRLFCRQVVEQNALRGGGVLLQFAEHRRAPFGQRHRPDAREPVFVTQAIGEHEAWVKSRFTEREVKTLVELLARIHE